MTGGSQLSQLKGKLRSTGLQRSSQSKSGKKTKRQPARDTDESRSKKLKNLQDEFNVFDFKSVRPKHAVASKQNPRAASRVAGKPSLSKSTAIEQRRKTLLPELLDRNRQGGIIDRRFGEDNPHLSLEEKNLERFTRERQRSSAMGGQGGKKGSLFNLEQEDELTHLGKSLGGEDMGGFGDADVGLPQEQAFAQYQRNMQDQPDDEESGRKRSRAEIMEEVVAKSKAYKYERQKTKDEDDELRLALDNDLDALRAALGGRPAPSTKTLEPKPASQSIVASIEEEDEEEGESSEEGSDSEEEEEELDEASIAAKEALLASKPGVDRALLAKLLGSPSPSPEPEANKAEAAEGEEDDDYDRYVKELVFEKRARPSNRLQTEEERALTASKDLLQQEEKRKKRMLGLQGDSEDDDEGKKKKRRKMMPQGDDLEDDFDLEGEEDGDAYGLGTGVTESGAFTMQDDDAPEDAGSEEQSGEDEAGSEEDFEGEEDDLLMDDLEADELLEEDAEPEALVSTSKKGKAKAKSSNLAFTYECPTTHEEFLDTLASVSENQLGVVVDRIRVMYHPKLAEANKDKLATFLGVLIDHVVYIAATTQSFGSINILFPHIFSLSNAYPLSAAQHFVAKLNTMQKNFMRGLSKSPLSPEAKTWPGIPELALLRLVGLVWSTSDFSHPVVAPALLLICQYLSQSRIRSASDISSGLMLCGIALQYESISKRIIPEVINFLVDALLTLASHSFKLDSVPGSFPNMDAFRPDLKDLKLNKAPSKSVPSRLDVTSLLSTKGTATEAEKATLLSTCLSLLDQFAQLYVSMDAFLELFSPIVEVLSGLTALPTHAKTQVDKLKTDLSRMLKLSRSSRKPLRLQQHRAVPIATYLPKFEDNYRPGQHAFDPDTARSETAKLKGLLKKEKKGAVRELRKDNRFLAGEQARIRQEKDSAYKAKITSIKAGLNAERSEEKEHERTKKRLRAVEKKRGGK